VDATIAKELQLLSAAINLARREWDWRIENPIRSRRPKLPGDPRGYTHWLQ